MLYRMKSGGTWGPVENIVPSLTTGYVYAPMHWLQSDGTVHALFYTSYLSTSTDVWYVKGNPPVNNDVGVVDAWMDDYTVVSGVAQTVNVTIQNYGACGPDVDTGGLRRGRGPGQRDLDRHPPQRVDGGLRVHDQLDPVRRRRDRRDRLDGAVRRAGPGERHFQRSDCGLAGRYARRQHLQRYDVPAGRVVERDTGSHLPWVRYTVGVWPAGMNPVEGAAMAGFPELVHSTGRPGSGPRLDRRRHRRAGELEFYMSATRATRPATTG